MNAPETSTQFLDLLVQSGLATRERAVGYAALVERSRHGANPKTLADRLVSDSLLTPFQGQQLLAGRHKGFFLGGKYKLLAHLGSGGMGEVYLAEHLHLNRLVAIKALRLEGNQSVEGTSAVERFFREGRAAATLQHQNIARLYDVERGGTTPYMVLEFVDGTNMHALVATHGRLSVPRAVNYVVQAARGLGHAHQNGLTHRDVKPGNLLLDRAGVVKLLDLGLVRFHLDASKNDNLTDKYDQNALIGTADFIAPEQTANSSDVDGRADIYSLGCTFYFFLTGNAPFEGGSLAQKILWHQVKPPPPVSAARPDVPPDLLSVLDRMMAKDRTARYQTMAEVEAALAPWFDAGLPPPADGEMPRLRPSTYRLGLVASAPADGSAIHTSPFLNENPATTATTTPAGRPIRRWVLFGLAQVAVVGIVAAVSWQLSRYSESGTYLPPPRPPSTDRPEPKTFAAGGSSFVQTLMTEWRAVTTLDGRFDISYRGLGSGEGLNGLASGDFDMACTEYFLTDEELKGPQYANKQLVHIPLAMGAVVPVYNLEGADGQLRLSGPVLADMFLGKIRSWDDPAVRELNRDRTLPARPITLVYRKGASGTTNILSDFLSKTSPNWAKKGAGRELIELPTGVAAENNKKMIAEVRATPGAIGYVDLASALQNEMAYALMRNKAGRYPDPASHSTVTAAAAATSVPEHMRYSITNPDAADAYPVAGTTWAVFDARMANKERLTAVIDFLDWATHDGQESTARLNYAPLPKNVVLMVEATLARIRRQ